MTGRGHSSGRSGGLIYMCNQVCLELFPHSAHVEIFVTFATKVLYLTFCNKMRQFLIQEMDKEGGNKEKTRKCRE